MKFNISKRWIMKRAQLEKGCSVEAGGPSVNVRKRAMVSVRLRFCRENMRTMESIVAMYEESEDPLIRRIATTARRRITKALAEPRPRPNGAHHAASSP